MTKNKKLLVSGVAVLLLALLGLVAYVVVAQVTVTSYIPTGSVVTVPLGTRAEIPFPHRRSFILIMSELWAASDATGFVVASENDCVISWVGLNGDGTVTKGTAAMNTPTVILKVKDVTLSLDPVVRCGHTVPVREAGQPGHALVIDAAKSAEGVRVTIIQ